MRCGPSISLLAAVIGATLLAQAFQHLGRPFMSELSGQESAAETFSTPKPENPLWEKATFGSGCFWCSEAVFQELKGVKSVKSGYSGGEAADPSYELVCSGTSGHAEVIQVTFDPSVVSYPQLLEVFWATHDPTTLNRQGNDIGTQYRSVIFYHDESQKAQAEHYKKRLNESGALKGRVVTEIAPLVAFYPAEAYHQDYFQRHSRQSYCTYVIVPKLEKFRKVFRERLSSQPPKSP